MVSILLRDTFVKNNEVVPLRMHFDGKKKKTLRYQPLLLSLEDISNYGDKTKSVSTITKIGVTDTW